MQQHVLVSTLHAIWFLQLCQSIIRSLQTLELSSILTVPLKWLLDLLNWLTKQNFKYFCYEVVNKRLRLFWISFSCFRSWNMICNSWDLTQSPVWYAVTFGDFMNVWTLFAFICWCMHEHSCVRSHLCACSCIDLACAEPRCLLSSGQDTEDRDLGVCRRSWVRMQSPYQ